MSVVMIKCTFMCRLSIRIFTIADLFQPKTMDITLDTLEIKSVCIRVAIQIGSIEQPIILISIVKSIYLRLTAKLYLNAILKKNENVMGAEICNAWFSCSRWQYYHWLKQVLPPDEKKRFGSFKIGGVTEYIACILLRMALTFCYKSTVLHVLNFYTT